MVVDRRRFFEPGYTYHVMNRGVERQRLFLRESDYVAFEELMAATYDLISLPIYSYELMPNHWHFCVGPESREQMSDFFQRLTGTHAKRFRRDSDTLGGGHVYQDRFKSFPIQSDAHFLTVCRYIERNALRANLVERAEDWRFGSMWRRNTGRDRILADWPIPRPHDWSERVNQPLTGEELASIRNCARRGTPFGDRNWQRAAAKHLGIEHTLRALGRPRKFGN